MISSRPLRKLQLPLQDRQTIPQVMEDALCLDSIACQEGSLHGLGHWHLQYAGQVEEIIQGFLRRNKVLPEKLQKYALSALSGCVL